jgi:hypothetical protein
MALLECFRITDEMPIENFIVILHYDDWNPCGIPASNLSFNLPIPSEAQAQLEQAALTAGLELGTIYGAHTSLSLFGF